MNFLFDVIYWGGVLMALLLPLVALFLIAVAIVKGAIHFAPVNVRDRRMDKELREMLSGGNKHESRR
jgi:hypothetical protein